MTREPNKKKSGWNLYWVASDGEEDCFVVARNSRSAAKFDADYCGFETTDVSVQRVCSIPTAVHRASIRRENKEGREHSWPWYADEWLLNQLGAQFRNNEGLRETLLNDVVYTQDSNYPIPPRPIGRRFLEQLKADKILSSYGDEDEYSPSQMSLFTVLGICIARCQEIEDLIAHSFILGLSDASAHRYETIGDMTKGWKKKTLGQMIRSIEDGYEIEPTVHASLRMFKDMRNKLVHGLTTSDKYNIQTIWGQDETIAFLALFEAISRPVRTAFRATFFASVEYGRAYLLPEGHERKVPKLSRKQQRDSQLFAAFFTPRVAHGSS